MNKRVLIGGLVLFASYFSFGIDFSRVNVAWQYDLSFEVQMSHRVFQDEDGLHVFLRIVSDSLNNWQYEFLVQGSYEAETHRSFIPFSIDTLVNRENEVFIQIDLKEIKENLLVLKFSQPEQFYYYDVPLTVGSLSFPSIYPIDQNDLPILKNHIHRSGYSWVGSGSFLAMKYEEAFQPADPPMDDMKPLVPQVNIDSSFIFRDSVLFEENYFYVVREDSLATVGVTILKVPAYFPKYRQLGELVEAMLYLTSEQEKKSILKSKDLKKSFDSFWVNTYSTKSRARNAIRAYYNRIEKSNLLFTDFKPGWKTDRGMMFIIYGLPNEVYRTTNSEEWYYDNGNAFEFSVISSFFAPRTFTLRRNNDFEQLWYSQIAALRQSINE